MSGQNEAIGPSSGPSSRTLLPIHRSRWAILRGRLFRWLIYMIAFVLILLVELGNISNKPVLRQTYFLKIDLSNIIPRSFPDAVLINSIARSIGLHDFYQVGLWNFCEGFEDGSGITYCSTPRAMYAFNPVDILLNELLAGATIVLPGQISTALDIARTASHWMFALFLVSLILTFLCLFLTPLSVPSTHISTAHISSRAPIANSELKNDYFKAPVSKRRNIPLTILTFLTFFTTLAASVIATAMWTIFLIVFSNNGVDLNIRAELGVRMLVFMWVATACTLLGFVMQCYELCSCCCFCCSKRQRRRRRYDRAMRQEKADGAGMLEAGGGTPVASSAGSTAVVGRNEMMMDAEKAGNPAHRHPSHGPGIMRLG